MEYIEMSAYRNVHGRVSPGYEQVANAFADNIASGLELGAACAIFKDGVPIVDVWGGISNRLTGTPWSEDTLVPVYSVTKGIAALVLLHLADQGMLNLDEPMARYWPEFAANGKQDVTVRAMLAHRSGLPYVEGDVQLVELDNPAHMASRLAAQVPLFEPGSTHSYHAITIGWLTSELVRRVTGEAMGAWVTRYASELGVDLWMGLPEVHRPRLALLEVRQPEPSVSLRDLFPPGSFSWKVSTLNGLIDLIPGQGNLDLNDFRLQSRELAGVNLITNARSLATFYSACLQGREQPAFVSVPTLADACRPLSTGIPFESVQPGPSWGTGVMIPWSFQPMLGPASCGHDGFGGSLAFVDPQSSIGFAYVRNRLGTIPAKDEAVYRVVDALRSLV